MASFRSSTCRRPTSILVLIFITFLIYRIIQSQFNPSLRSIRSRRKSIHFNSNISSSCACVDTSTGYDYDFCYYYYPSDSTTTLRGRRFSCEYLPILRGLNLLGDDNDDQNYFTNFDNRFFDNQKSPVFVTAASQSYFEQLLKLIQSIQKRFPKGKRIIFYDLGLSADSVKRIRNLCFVEYRFFNLDDYPIWVGRLYEFRWKPLVIAKALKEFDIIWYLDTSVRIESDDFSNVYALFNCTSSNTTNVLQNRKEKGHCHKFPYLLHGAAGHGTFSVTHPDLYKYIPTDESKLKSDNCNMYEAGFAFIVRTREVMQNVLKWYVLCALERDCMGPRGATAACSFNAVDRYGIYAKCHRFDQSVLNLLLANRHGFDSSIWSSGVNGRFYGIVRGQKLTPDEKNKLRYC